MLGRTSSSTIFNLVELQALQAWANSNMITTDFGSYAMEVNYASNGGSLMFAETSLVGLTIGNQYTLRTYVKDIVSNIFRIKINAAASDNTSVVAELGYGLGWRELIFTATATTMYLAVGDENPVVGISMSVSDNYSVKDVNGTEFVTNGTFEANNTTGWYGQDANTIISVYSYASSTPDNVYLEPVDIHIYNALDTTHVLITTSNGNESLLNVSNYTHFFVEPGNYESSTWTLTRSGTEVVRRTISLYVANDTHPGALTKSITELANIRIDISASYWTIDRMSYFLTSDYNKYGIRCRSGATNNIINRFFSSDVAYMFAFNDGSSDNIVQQSRFQNMIAATDAPAVEFAGVYGADSSVIINNKVVANEMYNVNDGIQLVRSPSSDYVNYQTVNFEGTIIDSNVIWVDSTVQAGTEDAIDIKGGTSNSLNPVIITNNIFFGYNGLNGRENNCMVMHYNPRNIHFKNNVCFDNGKAFYTGANGSPVIGEAQSLGLIDSEIEGNLFYDSGKDSVHAVGALSMRSTVIQNNAIIDCATGFLDSGYNATSSEFKLNDICNTPNVHNDRGGSDTTWDSSISNNTHYATATLGGYTSDFVVDYDVYTSSPKQIILTNAVKP